MTKLELDGIAAAYQYAARKLQKAQEAFREAEAEQLHARHSFTYMTKVYDEALKAHMAWNARQSAGMVAR